jgi:UDP-3-O-[3-hydroxymyristoyl] glucosamine N-acyltransferase
MPTVGQIVDLLAALGETTLPLPAGGVGDREIRGIAQDRTAGPDDLAWLSPKRAIEDPARAREFGGAVLIAPLAAGHEVPAGGGLIVPCANPKVAFSRVVMTFFPSLAETRWPGPADGSIAVGTQMGQRVVLGAGVVIGSGVSLGDDVIIGPNSCLANCTVGSRVAIGCNCTIGLPGFGYEKDRSGQYYRFPHIGQVVIEDDVEIGSNTCIDRGAIGDTVIGQGSKIDNLVHIAHNVVVGRNVLIIANSMVAGSTTIEDDVWLAPSSAMMNQIRVGRGDIVGLGAVVLKDVPPGAVVAGNPARPLERRDAQ